MMIWRWRPRTFPNLRRIPYAQLILEAIRDGAGGFFRTQYGTISKMVVLLGLVIMIIYLLRSTNPQQESSGLGRATTAYITVASFLLGAIYSGVAGYVEMCKCLSVKCIKTNCNRNIIDSTGSLKVTDCGTGIPEDDRRNLLIWLETMLVIVVLERRKIEDPYGFILFLLVVHAFDLVISSVGIFSLHNTLESVAFSVLEDPMDILQKGYSVTILLFVSSCNFWFVHTLDVVYGTSTYCMAELFLVWFGRDHYRLSLSQHIEHISWARLRVWLMGLEVQLVDCSGKISLEVFIGGLLGSMLIFLFSAWACATVGRSAQEVVNEVRRQFIKRPGIMDYKEKPYYGRSVGIVFRVLGYYTSKTLLGAKVVASMLIFTTASGILMALFLNIAGGAWDNEKKCIEIGAMGGKGSECHKAAVTGVTCIFQELIF
ncbi:inorganic diphosphatase [Salvia divinorum]|uniref:H(+)-exporting diphosphatase n=1 Tax=Salvia divinorum TaxID=28513 RepID=A0ABD1I830_SALDI